MHALRHANRAFRHVERNHERPRRAIQVALDRRLDERRGPSCKHPSRTEDERGVEFGQRPQVRTVGTHRPEIAKSSAVALEHDAGAIGRERAPCVACIARRQPHRLASRRGGAPEIAAPGEEHDGTVGRERGETRKVDRRSLGRGWGQEERRGHDRAGGEAKDPVARGEGRSALHAMFPVTDGRGFRRSLAGGRSLRRPCQSFVRPVTSLRARPKKQTTFPQASLFMRRCPP